MKAPWKGELRIRDRHPEAAIVDLVDERGEPVVLAVNRLVAGAIVERCSSELERAVFQAGFKRGTQEGPRPAVWDSPDAAERFEREYLGTFAIETPMGPTSHIEREFITGRDPGDEGPAPDTIWVDLKGRPSRIAEWERETRGEFPIDRTGGDS